MEGIFSGVFDCSDSNPSITCEIFRSQGPRKMKNDAHFS